MSIQQQQNPILLAKKKDKIFKCRGKGHRRINVCGGQSKKFFGSPYIKILHTFLVYMCTLGSREKMQRKDNNKLFYL